jgi:flagellar FliL protein
MSEEIEVSELVEEPKQGKKMLIIAMTIGLSVGALAGSLVVGPLLAESSGGDHAAEDCLAALEGGHGGLPEAPLAVHSIENIVINPAQSAGTRFLMVSVGFGLKDAHGVESIALRDAELRDIIVRTLGSKTVEELSDMATRDTLKSEIRQKAVGLIGEAALLDVYLPQFVIQ